MYNNLATIDFCWILLFIHPTQDRLCGLEHLTRTSTEIRVSSKRRTIPLRWHKAHICFHAESVIVTGFEYGDMGVGGQQRFSATCQHGTWLVCRTRPSWLTFNAGRILFHRSQMLSSTFSHTLRINPIMWGKTLSVDSVTLVSRCFWRWLYSGALSNLAANMSHFPKMYNQIHRASTIASYPFNFKEYCIFFL